MMKKVEKSNKDIINEELRVSPAARKIAAEKIDPQSIKGSGKNGLSFKRGCNEFNGY